MKYISLSITSLVFLTFYSCAQNCTSKNIDLIGSWNVHEVEMVDSENELRDFMTSKNEDYESYLEKLEILKKVDFIFREDGEALVKNPDELGGDGVTPYKYENGSDEIIIGDRTYKFVVNNCNEIEIVDLTQFESAWLIMYCRRVDGTE